MSRSRVLLIATVSCPLIAIGCPSAPGWLTAGDPIDPSTGEIYEIVPGAPRIQLQQVRDTADTIEVTEDTEDDSDLQTTLEVGPEIGDIDLVIRSVAAGPAAIPPAAPFRSQEDDRTLVANRRGTGSGLAFTVFGSDGQVPLRSPNEDIHFPGHPVLVMAFADLDGDGFIGITELDADPFDRAIEAQELRPIARRYALVDQTTASGELFIPTGGPPGAELEIGLSAVTYIGLRSPSFYGGGVPTGPAIMTKLPFHPVTEKAQVLGTRPTSAHADSLVGAKIIPLLTPDPGDPATGEAFTMRLDGSQPSIDTARVRSRPFVRFAIARRLGALVEREQYGQTLRPGLDPEGGRALYDIMRSLTLWDDGEATQTTVTVLPVDDLSNITTPGGPREVTIAASGPIQILSPDRDGDPQRESLIIDSARGADIIIDDLGGRWDGDNRARIDVSGDFAQNRLAVWLPDPDIDDSGEVDATDAELLSSAMDSRRGDPEFSQLMDLDGNGRIRDNDLDLLTDALGELVPVP